MATYRGIRSGCRMDSSIKTRSVTKGSGTNDESIKDEQKIPRPPSAGRVEFSQKTARPQEAKPSIPSTKFPASQVQFLRMP